MLSNLSFFVDRPDMADPLAQVVSLLHPTARFSKRVEGAGDWCVHREGQGEPFYVALLAGECRLTVDDQPPLHLQAGDFVLVPALRSLFNCSAGAGVDAVPELPVRLGDGWFRVGRQEGPAEVLMQIGHCQFESPDAPLLVSLLPQVLHVRGVERLATLVEMVGDESRSARPGREVVLERLLELLLIEALRSAAQYSDGAGLVYGLADERLAGALRAIHEQPERAWTVASLAVEAALSRSSFSARFTQVVGVAPMEYVLAWRMALAKQLLRSQALTLEQVAERVGYASAVTFSAAFVRRVGVAPGRYGRVGI